MRKALFFLVCAALLLAVAAPAWAEGEAVTGADPGQAVQAPENGGAAAPTGVQPVDPHKLAVKVQKLGDAVYGAASPIADMLARLAVGAAGVLLILLIVLGTGIVRRVAVAVLAVMAGLGLWYGAPYIVGLVKYFTNWLVS